MRSVRLALLPGVLAAALALSPGRAVACNGAKLLFADDFKTATPAWGRADADFTIAAGKLGLRAKPGMTRIVEYADKTFQSLDACVSIRMPGGERPEPIDAGLVFWYVDPANYAVFEISSSGGAALAFRKQGEWIFADARRYVAALDQTGDATNTIRVTLDGPDIATYINGRPFVTLKGAPPAAASGIGLTAGSTGALPGPVEFSGLKITDLP